MSAAVKPELVRADTGEVVNGAVVPFDMATYLSEIKTDRAVAQQHDLMAAYDRACQALIGPNDVQKEGNRSFKKKSAWRKLARHFGISVECGESDVRLERKADGTFVAVASARAVAPWGQGWSDVGACGSDEATGRRVITIADAIATAMTRASNRAVSNLIAMGEVSAEEIGDRRRQTASAPQQAKAPKPPRDKALPFATPARAKGTRLGDLSIAELEALLTATETERFNGLRDAINEVLEEKRHDGFEEFPSALADEHDDLPF